MSTAIEFTLEDVNDIILPSQYSDLIRRRAPFVNGEYRLLWAVLEDAIRAYLANRTRSNAVQRKSFEEVRSWFESNPAQSGSLFEFRNICDLLEIDAGQLLKGLKSLEGSEFPRRRYRLCDNTRLRTVAA